MAKRAARPATSLGPLRERKLKHGSGHGGRAVMAPRFTAPFSLNF